MSRSFVEPERVLATAVVDRAFPGAAYAIVHGSDAMITGAVGRFTFEPDSPPVTQDTIYDLASLTKVIATTAVAMLLYERSKLDLDAPVVSLAPAFHEGEDLRRDQVTLRMLLTHTSGLPGYERLFQRAHSRDELINAALTTPLAADPGTRTEYSDLGFIILAEILTALAGEPLPAFCQREIFTPLRMTHSAFNPPPAWLDRIPPTEDDRTFRHRIIRGEVNDENASVMGGVAGHAGLFGTAHDVAIFARCLLQGGSPVFRSESVEFFTARQRGSTRALGWDKPTAPSSSGRYFSERAYGHLGFTGTSLWIDPDRQLAVVLLTNRTWPDRSNEAIKQIRPRFHDAVVESINAS